MKKEDNKITKRHMLFKKKKTMFKSYYETGDFKEPIIVLLRRTQNAEFFENATKEEFSYTHSDGTERLIYLNQKYLQSFPYGKKVFKGYICHEDYPIPLPTEPTVTTETVGIAIDKTLNDIKKWKAQEWRAKGNFYWKLALGVMGILGMYILYRMLIPDNSGTVERTIVQTVQTINQSQPIPTVIGG